MSDTWNLGCDLMVVLLVAPELLPSLQVCILRMFIRNVGADSSAKYLLLDNQALSQLQMALR